MTNALGPRVALLTAAAVAVFLGRTSLSAQSRAFKSGVELVSLPVTVTDRGGRYLRDLRPADFAIFEEGHRQEIVQFASGDVPIDMALLLDTSSSMSDALPLAQEAACGLVQRLRAGDRAAVTDFGSSVSFRQPLTTDLPRVGQALRATRARGNTALYDAVYIMLRQYQQESRNPAAVRRRVIVLLTDGIDTSSHLAFEDVLDLVRHVDATAYVVSLGGDPAPLRNVLADRRTFEAAHALSTLASESGGRLFTPRTARELPAIYAAIGQELSFQYVLGYVPSQVADGTFRRISVGVLEPHAGVARTRAGYYAVRTGDVERGTASLDPIVR